MEPKFTGRSGIAVGLALADETNPRTEPGETLNTGDAGTRDDGLDAEDATGRLLVDVLRREHDEGALEEVRQNIVVIEEYLSQLDNENPNILDRIIADDVNPEWFAVVLEELARDSQVIDSEAIEPLLRSVAEDERSVGFAMRDVFLADLPEPLLEFESWYSSIERIDESDTAQSNVLKWLESRPSLEAFREEDGTFGCWEPLLKRGITPITLLRATEAVAGVVDPILRPAQALPNLEFLIPEDPRDSRLASAEEEAVIGEVALMCECTREAAALILGWLMAASIHKPYVFNQCRVAVDHVDRDGRTHAIVSYTGRDLPDLYTRWRTGYAHYQAHEESDMTMELPDDCDSPPKHVPFHTTIRRRVDDALSSGRKDRVREAERLRERGDEKYREDRYDLAIDAYRESLRLNPDDMITVLNLVRAYRASHQISNALVVAGSALVLMDNPAHQSRIWSVIGHCNCDNFERSESQEDLLATIHAFDCAAKLDPDDVIPPWMLLATILSASKNHESFAVIEDLESRAKEAATDLIRLFRKAEGNAAIYADSIAAAARQLRETIPLPGYWRSKLETLEEHARVQSGTQPGAS